MELGACGVVFALLPCTLQFGETALIRAAREGNAERVRALLEAGADISSASVGGWTALHWAAYNDNPLTLELLLSRAAAACVNATTVRRGTR